MDQSFYEHFSIDTAARLRAHDHAMEAHEARMQAHEEQMQEMRAAHREQMQEMRAAHAVWVQTWNRQEAGLQAIADRLAAGMIDHEARLSDHQRAMQEMSTTLQAIRNSL